VQAACSLPEVQNEASNPLGDSQRSVNTIGINDKMACVSSN